MTRLIRTIALSLLTALTLCAAEDRFALAQQAYDDGRYAEAALLYEELLSTGIVNPEVHYNLANSYFKDGNLPKAVWHYRTAWYAAPRDPDIRANLHFALNAAGAVDPAPQLMQRFFFGLSRTEWVRTAVAGYVVFTLLLMLSLLFRRSRRPLQRLSVLPAALILLAAGGWWQWQQLHRFPEWVVSKPGATALFGPVEGSTAHYKLPPGALVQQKSSPANHWIEIAYDGKNGWLKAEYIDRLSP